MTSGKKGRGKRKKKRTKKVVQDERQVELLPEMRPPVTTESESVSVSETDAEGTDSVSTVEIDVEPEESVVPPPPTPTASPVRPRPSEATVRPAGNQLARARDLVGQGRVHEAIELYGEIVAENPESMKAHNNLGVLFDELGQHANAVEHFEEALRLDPESVEILTNNGTALTSLARYEDAESMLRRALRLAPEDFGARLAVGILTFRRGLYLQCELELRWVCERDPANGLAFYYRAEALNRVGRFEDSSALMERAAELMPTDPRPFYTLGHLFDRKSLHVEAEAMYKRARELQVP